MLRRRAYDRLLEWKESSKGSTALLVEGARRVGKSYLVEEFGRREYGSYLIVDFSSAPDEVRSYFLEMRNDLDSLFLYLSAFYGVELRERDSLIVFDEVQFFPKARESIKQLVADGRYDYIETGSLVSIRENVRDILIPSEERALELSPMDFEEFLWAMGEVPLAGAISRALERREALPDLLHRKAMRLFREYMLVGGMPQAVQEYVDTRDFGRVDAVKRDILALYRNDIAKHAGSQTARVTSLFDGLVGQLSKHEKRFNLASLGKSARMRDYEDAFFWLSDARVTNDCFNAEDPSVGLAISADHATRKCYMADTGLLVSQAFADASSTEDGVYRDMLLGKVDVNEGMLVENVVAQQLRASGRSLYFYSRSDRENSKNRMEIDFLITLPYADAGMKPRVSPIEVKSGARYSTVSLDKFKAKFGKRVGYQIVLHPRQLRVEGDRLYLPLYMATFL